MKYVVNTRGGAKQVDDHLLPLLLAQGYTEITKAQFEAKPYYPEYDLGVEHQVSSAPTPQLQVKASSAQTSRESFKTRIV